MSNDTNYAQRIKEYFLTDRSYAGALMLYIGHPKALAGLSRAFNGSTGRMIEKLHYELAKLEGMQKDYPHWLCEPLSIGERKDIPPLPVEEQTTESIILQIAENHDIIEGKTLRDEFPFLAAQDCPDEFKILVADKINAYHRFVEGHHALFCATDIDYCLAKAKQVTDNFVLNQQIYEELDYYAKNGKILGKHPRLILLSFAKSLQEKNTQDLSRILNGIRVNISRNTDNPEKSALWREKEASLLTEMNKRDRHD